MMHLMKHHQYHRQKVRRLNYLLERIKVRGETKSLKLESSSPSKEWRGGGWCWGRRRDQHQTFNIKHTFKMKKGKKRMNKRMNKRGNNRSFDWEDFASQTVSCPFSFSLSLLEFSLSRVSLMQQLLSSLLTASSHSHHPNPHTHLIPSLIPLTSLSYEKMKLIFFASHEEETEGKPWGIKIFPTGLRFSSQERLRENKSFNMREWIGLQNLIMMINFTGYDSYSFTATEREEVDGDEGHHHKLHLLSKFYLDHKEWLSRICRATLHETSSRGFQMRGRRNLGRNRMTSRSASDSWLQLLLLSFFFLFFKQRSHFSSLE